MNASGDRQSAAVHRIRLGSQWDLEPLADDATGPAMRAGGERLKQLSDYAEAAGPAFHGRVRLSRWFGRPTGLSSQQRVELVAAGLPTAMAISLNDEGLTPLPIAHVTTPDVAPSLVRFDVSTSLQDRNRLALEFDVAERPRASCVTADVWLEIIGDGP